jgi:hypothetical protein
VHKPRLDPSIIDQAPLVDNATLPQDPDYIDQLETLLFTLQAELDESQAEVERLSASKTVTQVRASMMEPFANKVFWFLCAYCAVAAVILILSGIAHNGFLLSDTILAILIGSTLVSAIGLVRVVVNGLFFPTAKDEQP